VPLAEGSNAFSPRFGRLWFARPFFVLRYPNLDISPSHLSSVAEGRTRLCSNRALGLRLQNSHPLLHSGSLRHSRVSRGSHPFWSNPSFDRFVSDKFSLLPVITPYIAHLKSTRVKTSPSKGEILVSFCFLRFCSCSSSPSVQRDYTNNGRLEERWCGEPVSAGEVI
jgi:hypothetical protein